jgi:OPA family glycerol-3-phosphate transporter-like MFS transporter
MNPSRDAAAPGSLRAWKWRVLLATMLCYLFYYCGRFNLAVCMKPLMDEFGWDKARMGYLASVLIVTYGIGQFFNGSMTDRFGRVLMPLGAVVSCAANWAFSYAPELGAGWARLAGVADVPAAVFGAMAVVWGVNGYFQAMGMAPGGRLISNWWAHEERGLAMGLFTFSSAMANVTVFLLASAAAGAWGWRAAFRYPVLLMAAVALLFYGVTKDRPEDVGLESPVRPGAAARKRATSVGRYLAAFGNRAFLVAGGSIALHHVARWGLLTFIPIYFMETYGWKIKEAGFTAAALPLGMALGAVSGGIISDRFFRGKRSTVIAVSLVLCAACILALPAVERIAGAVGGWFAAGEAGVSLQAIAAAMLVVSGYMLYLGIGPYFALPADLLGPESAGTGIGLMNAFAYAGAGVGTSVGGLLIKNFGYAAGFWFMAGCALAGALLIVQVREPVSASR